MTSLPPRPPERPASVPPRLSKPATQADIDRALALRDVMDHAVRVQREISEAKPLHRSGRLVTALVICMPLLAFCIYSFVARPDFIWGTAVALPPAQRDANGRVALFLLAQRIETIRAERGHYPETLREIGEEAAGLQYRLVGDSVFELRFKPDSASEIIFNSTENAARFLGDSPMKIQGRQR
jgi:hypothetical protein